MKILFNCHLPFTLAHGGWATQIEQTKTGLEANGVAVEFMRWWDSGQRGDIMHFFGRTPAEQIRFAQQKGIKVVMAELLTAPGARSRSQLRWQKIISRSVERLAPRSFTAAFNWNAYRWADAVIANTPWEAHLMNYLFDAPKERIHVLPNGVEEIFLNSSPVARGKWLVCTTTITERKRVLELAAAAVAAQTPLWIIGRAYAETDAYAQKFFALARKHQDLIRYEGPVQDRAQLAGIYRAARGFVLLSSMETRSLSAEEAAACECPLLLSDLPWARDTFKQSVSYCPISSDMSIPVKILRQFYDQAPQLPIPPKPLTWAGVGRQLKLIYEGILKN